MLSMSPQKRRSSVRQTASQRELGPGLQSIANVLALITLAACLWLTLIERHDPYHCRSLLSDGSWPARSWDRDPDQDFEHWEPRSCRMVEYSRDTFHDCLGGRRVLFAGDSSVRQIYWAAATRLDHMKAHVALLDAFVDDSKHDNLQFEAEGVKLEFIWDPWLNSSFLHNELTKFQVQESFVDVGTVKSKDEESAALVILGAPGLWAARHGGDDYMEIFRRGIESVRIHLGSNLGDTLFSPTSDLRRNYDQAPNQILLAPIQTPWYDSLNLDRAATITPDRVDKMNHYLRALPSDEQSHMLWAYNEMTAGDANTMEVNGIHVVDRVAERKIDIALNARCNAARGHQLPHATTCCIKYPERTLFQTAVLLGAGIAAVWTAFAVLRQRKTISVVGYNASLYEVPAAVCYILIIVAYCVIADRSHKFVKLDRHYSETTLINGFLLFGLLSLLSRRSSSQQFNVRPQALNEDDKGFLSRDQSNEWKGWMQAAILIYHYNHASEILWVYKLIRLLVSSYVFLSGYGHTMYLLRTDDYSFRRMAAVVFRLNLLTVLLPYMMGTDYNFYYFAPLITFWYLVVYVTLWVFRRYNQDPLVLFAKIFVVAVITNSFIIAPQPLNWLSTICRSLFHMHWEANELLFRLSLDRYIVFVGMATASIAKRMSDLRSSQTISGWAPPTGSGVRRSSRIDPMLSVLVFPDALTKPIKPLACAFSSLFILFFTIVTQTQVREKTLYNATHPYISWVPILSFLILRNSLTCLRNSYLQLPAILGEISLETYVLQYHIWLGGDATAKLRLGFWDRYAGSTWFAGLGRWSEVILITAVFICASAYARHATEVLTKWIFYANSPSRLSGFADRRQDMSLKERDSEDGKGRPVSEGDGRCGNYTLSGARDAEIGSFGKLRRKLAQDARTKALMILALLWAANMLYV